MVLFAERPLGVRSTTKAYGGERKGMKVSLASPTKKANLSPALEARVQEHLSQQAMIAQRDQTLMRNMAFLHERQAAREQGELERRRELERVMMEDRAARCAMEQRKPAAPWPGISQDTVLNNHDKRAPGMFYGLEFPWNEDLFVEFGPEWFTKAFRLSEVMSPSNEVTQIITGGKKITAGNNGAKCLFELRYKMNEPGLDTKLFAKLPYPMTPATKTDRISSSVRKQPMDWSEINTYRMFEAALPFKTPKYYYGDISPFSSNFVLILGRIPFVEYDGPSKKKLKPFEVEGPYDKCKDYMLKSRGVEYYRVMASKIAMLGGQFSAGKFSSKEVILKGANLGVDVDHPGFRELCNSMVQDFKQYKQTVTSGYTFFSKTAPHLYPQYVKEQWFEDKYTRAMMQLNAYASELFYWKEGPICPYRGIGHMNQNIDNSYFWRDERGEMDCGCLDWGGFGINNMAHKLWWSMNCSDWEMIRDHTDDLIKLFIETYEEHGGPHIEFEHFKMSFMITMLQNFFMMIGALPNSFKMCKAAEFATIYDFNDPRISEDVDGKSTLRTTVWVINNGLRMIAEMGAADYLDRWVTENCDSMGFNVKSEEELVGRKPVLTLKARCDMEQTRPPAPWQFISQETVLENHKKRSKGIFYGMEFPWSEDTLLEFGPEWLTQAFHESQVMSDDNAVTAISTSGQKKITAGNNGAKCFFEVRYKRDEPGLETKLFAKMPYPMTPATKTDRISSSVRKQPMDWKEIATYRLFEGYLPFKTPKYYWGDISNETTNFILLLGRIPFAELSGPTKNPLKPYEVEGPYDKCKDRLMLKSPSIEYYRVMVDKIATLGGIYVSGKFASERAVEQGYDLHQFKSEKDPNLLTWSQGMVVPAKQHAAVVIGGYRFMAETAKNIYPEYVQEDWFRVKYTRAMNQFNAYAAEINIWKEGPRCNYRTVGHMNCNIDNAYFWRDEDGKLDCGCLDWGGFGVNNLAHKVWWSMNCSDYEMIRDNLDDILKRCLVTFEENGGPHVDFEDFKMSFMITMLQNFLQMVGAIPNSLKMCKAHEFATIYDWSDPRIADDVDGKSTLRTTLWVLNNGVRMIGEMHVTDYLDRWVEEVYVGKLGKVPLTEEELLSDAGAGTGAGAAAAPDKKPILELKDRCDMEQAKPAAPWQFISQETVLANHSKRAPGIFYGMEFPWSEDTIVEFGPEFLTKAFRASQVMSSDNEVTEIITGKRKITAGNNGAKSLFEVRYKYDEPGLEEKLFAKLPYPMTPATKTDRISSSVRKQPMDWSEINTYRLFEGYLPFKTPKYYFGDITPETSNFVLLLGRIPFAELDGPSYDPLKPFEVEGPYEKCKDVMLKRPGIEYYKVIAQKIAQLGGAYIAGNFATPEAIKAGCLIMAFSDINDPGLQQWSKSLVVPIKQHGSVVAAGYRFLKDTAEHLYPEYVKEDWFRIKYTKAMMQINAYAAELNIWKEGPGCAYRAIGHMNCNIDNAYFWRDQDGQLDCGCLDWGGFGVNNLAHKLWWSVNCSDFEMLKDNLDELIQTFLDTLEAWGGPHVEFEDFKMSFMITMLQNFLQMVGAIPNSLKMCKAQEFKTIYVWDDPRIASDVDGKSTLRTTVWVLNNGVRLIGELNAVDYLDRWIKQVYCPFGLPEKTDKEIGFDG